MNRSGGSGDFDRWLEQELRRTVVSAHGPSPRAAQAAYRDASRRGGKLLAIKSRILASVGVKGVAGIAAAALTLGGGAVVAMAATGSANPAAFGQKVSEMVETCKAKAGEHGASNGGMNVGRCVSAFARTHGEAQQTSKGNTHDNDQTSPSPKAGSTSSHGQSGQTHGQSGQTHGQSTGSGTSGDTHGQSGDHSHPTPSPKTS
jgi:hypothetical protein